MEQSSRSLRVLCVDDHPLFLAGLCGAWRTWRSQDEVLDARCATAVSDVVGTRGCDVVIVDLVLPDGSGLDVAAALLSRTSPLVVMLSSYDSPAVVEACRRVGLRGFFSKELPIRTLFYEVERLLAMPGSTSFPDGPNLPDLTNRELEVFRLLLYHQSNAEIAAGLHISTETVKTHISALLAKLGAQDRFGAAEIGRRLGYQFALPHLRDGSPV